LSPISATATIPIETRNASRVVLLPLQDSGAPDLIPVNLQMPRTPIVRNKRARVPVLLRAFDAAVSGSADCPINPTIEQENHMKLLVPALAVLTLSAVSLSAGAITRADLYGERAQAPAAQTIVSAVYGRTIEVTGETKWVNVKHGEVIRFVSN